MGYVDGRSVAALLGVKSKGEVVDTLDLAKAVSNGLSVDALDRLCGLIAPGDAKLRHLIVPKATLARRQRGQGRLSPEESDRFARLARLWALAMDVWKSEAAAQRFLVEPHPLLRGRVPRELTIESDFGARAVEDLLGRLKYGSGV